MQAGKLGETPKVDPAQDRTAHVLSVIAVRPTPTEEKIRDAWHYGLVREPEIGHQMS